MIGDSIVDQEEIIVSVIMPVYNAAKYVGHTIQSVLDQSYSNFELILVDDGATDGSGAICDQYAEKDSRIRVVHQENGGICRARNVGLDSAKGKYIAFCDHDDEMLRDCLEKTVLFAEKEKVDVVRFSRRHIDYNEYGKAVDIAYIPEMSVVEIENWSSYLKVIQSAAYGPWAGLYRKDFLLKYSIRFNETVRFGYEDTIFVAQCCGNAKSIGLLPDTLYDWVTRTSVSTSRNRGIAIFENRKQAVFIWKSIEDEIGERLGRNSKQAEIRMVDYLQYIMTEICRLDMPNKKKKKMYCLAKKQLLNGLSIHIGETSTFKAKVKFYCIRNNFVWLYEILQKISLRMRTKQIECANV